MRLLFFLFMELLYLICGQRFVCLTWLVRDKFIDEPSKPDSAKHANA